jgi:hypothetical protein
MSGGGVAYIGQPFTIVAIEHLHGIACAMAKYVNQIMALLALQRDFGIG